MNAFGGNFLPGPTGVLPEVMAAMLEPMYAHYGPRMRPILEEIQPALQTMLGTARPVFAVTCSGTGLMEAAIRNAVRHRVLVVVSGYFGEYFVRIAEECGKDVVRVHVPLGRTIEADQLATFLDGPPIDAVAVVHSESSTGALAPIEDLARVVRDRPDVMFIVDGVSSAAGIPIEMDRIGIDFMLTGSQKALGLPPGLAFGAVSPRMEQRARELADAGHYFSVTRWVRMAAEYELFETPALPVYHALLFQLRRIAATGGWPARWIRHRELAETVWSWAEQRAGAVSLLAPGGRRSHTVSALRLAPPRDPAGIIAELDQRGFQISRALDRSHGPVIRIGHMGDIQLEHLRALLDTLDTLL
jgi:aspartate aminotransferase-like enzyme